MPFCNCGDVTLYFETVGSGHPLLLLSGLSGGTWSWFGQVPFLSGHYRVVCFDNRGAGQSSMPEGPYEMLELARDALRLLDRLEVEQAFVLGLSMGGMIAQELALLAPERVRALVLGCTHSGGPTRFAPPAYALNILVSNDGLTQAEIIDKNMPLFMSEDFMRARPDVLEAYRRAQLSAPIQPDHAFRAQLAAIAGFDCSQRLHEIEAPTLVITGSRDVLVPRANAYFLAQHIAGAKLVELHGAGHALHVECRDRLNGLAHEFFQGQQHQDKP